MQDGCTAPPPPLRAAPTLPLPAPEPHIPAAPHRQHPMPATAPFLHAAALRILSCRRVAQLSPVPAYALLSILCQPQKLVTAYRRPDPPTLAGKGGPVPLRCGQNLLGSPRGERINFLLFANGPQCLVVPISAQRKLQDPLKSRSLSSYMEYCRCV